MADAPTNKTYLLTVKQAAKELGFSRSYVDTEIREGRLEARKIGRNVRIEASELERWIRTHPTKIEVSIKALTGLNTISAQKSNLQVIDNARLANRGRR